MPYVDRATTLAEALDNLTGENWHTERELVEAALAQRDEIIRELVRANDTPDGAVGDVDHALGAEAASTLREILNA